MRFLLALSSRPLPSSTSLPRAFFISTINAHLQYYPPLPVMTSTSPTSFRSPAQSPTPAVSPNQSAGTKRKRGSSSPKFYAVKNGFKPGIYYSWDECFPQVKGYKGAICKSKLPLMMRVVARLTEAHLHSSIIPYTRRSQWLPNRNSSTRIRNFEHINVQILRRPARQTTRCIHRLVRRARSDQGIPWTEVSQILYMG